MIIGISKEVKEQEYRVSITPAAAYQSIKLGHQVLLETEAGAGAGFPDQAYADVEATIVPGHAEVFERAELIVKVKEPMPSEYALLQRGQLLSPTSTSPRTARSPRH